MTETSVQTILIVDDEIQNRKLLEILLRPEGYRTLTAANGEEALAMIAENPPDLILLDIMMPGIDGYEVAAILKAGPSTANIPIIMVTALADRGARIAGLSAGAEEFLTKPVDRTELWLRVRALLRWKKLADLHKQAQAEIIDLNDGLEIRVLERTAQLLEVNQELESFSYSVSHDLRSPLNSIDGFSSLLGKEIGANDASERAKHYLARIRAGVSQMGALIDALLSLSHVSRTPLTMESVDLSALALAVLGACREREADRLAEVDVEPGLVVQGDPHLLRQVMENLLGNAWKFSGKQALTCIAFRCESHADGTAVYAVRDNGAGFNMAHADKLFGTFQRLHTALEFPGTGIGLATVQRIITRHSGKISAESAPDQGATFYFTLGSSPVRSIPATVFDVLRPRRRGTAAAVPAGHAVRQSCLQTPLHP